MNKTWKKTSTYSTSCSERMSKYFQSSSYYSRHNPTASGNPITSENCSIFGRKTDCAFFTQSEWTCTLVFQNDVPWNWNSSTSRPFNRDWSRRVLNNEPCTGGRCFCIIHSVSNDPPVRAEHTMPRGRSSKARPMKIRSPWEQKATSLKVKGRGAVRDGPKHARDQWWDIRRNTRCIVQH